MKATIGRPLARLDGPPKVTGEARYGADHAVAGLLDGLIVPSPVAAGRILALGQAAARGVPGVVEIFSRGNFPRLGPVDHWALGQNRLPFQSDQIAYEGEPVALIVADSRAAAAEAALRLEARFESAASRISLDRYLGEAVEAKDWAANTAAVGEVDRGLARADARIDAVYRTASRHHAAIEPAVAVARWEAGTLDLLTSTQWVYGVRAALAQTLGLAPDRVRVRTAFVGGGFGAKGSTWPHEILAAVAARELGRPVRIALPRGQSFTAHGYQPATVQRLTLGARRDGTLVAIRHEGTSVAARDDDYVEHASMGTRSLYACPNIETRDTVVRLNVPQPTFMRAPHEGPGMVALEIAMDELACEVGLDPVELRLRNYAETDPLSGKPFSSKALRECYALAAERFGWARRSPEPGGMRDGSCRVGYGMASAIMTTFRIGAAARITIHRDGRVVVGTAAHDIGTGVATALAQIAGSALGVDPDRIQVELGDTLLPEAGGTFGSSTTIGVGSAVAAAAAKLRRRLEKLGGEPDLAPEEYPELLALRRLDQVSEAGTWAPARGSGAPSMHAFGAVFVEVRVDRDIPIPRIGRVVGAYSVGRVINPVLARSQIAGGIAWGIGQALLESSPLDPVLGRFVAKSLSSYRIPVSADVPPIDVIFAEEHDPEASPLGVRGVGEIGAIGIGAAIANAVFNATGVRLREVPIRVEAVL
jgi:xanthine dehydrogenase YagR molybdenum-binding subunit